MRNLYHTCKFSTLTINFSVVWPRQIVDLGKQFTLMIRPESTFARPLEDIFKMSWRHFEDVLKTPSRRLEDVLKTSWRRLEGVLKTSWRLAYGQDEYIDLDQDVLKISSEDVWLRRIYSSWSRRLEDVFIKTNVCWEVNLKIGPLLSKISFTEYILMEMFRSRILQRNLRILTRKIHPQIKFKRFWKIWKCIL